MQGKKLIKRLEEINNLLSKNVDLKLINEKDYIMINKGLKLNKYWNIIISMWTSSYI